MADKHGDFIWYELMTRDIAAAKAFYGGLLGWTFEDSHAPGYTMISKGEAEIGGILALSEAMRKAGAITQWAGYVAVDDIEKSLAKALSGGATTLLAPTKTPAGCFAMFADPQGAVLYIMQSDGPPSQSFAKYTSAHGHCAWNELMTVDPEASRAFYADLFGWKPTGEMDLGSAGLYTMLGTHDYTFGAVMAKPDNAPAPRWKYYFRVHDITAAAAYVTAQGGKVLSTPTQIPGGDYTMDILDPDGAFLALIGTDDG